MFKANPLAMTLAPQELGAHPFHCVPSALLPPLGAVDSHLAAQDLLDEDVLTKQFRII